MRGALADLPQLGGQALQFVGAQGIGQTISNFGQGMAQKPWLQMNPAAHNGMTNALAQGAEQIAPIAAVPLALGAAAAAAPFDIPAAALAGAGAVGGGALFGAQAGEQTLEKAQQKGVNPDDARTAANLSAAGTFATMTGLGLVGGQMLGKVGTAVGKMVGTEGADAASDIITQMSGQGGVLSPFLKQLPISAAEAVGVGAAQAGVQAQIENSYGIDDTSPLEAMKDSIVPMLGLTAITTPLGLVSRALGVRSAARSAQTLASGDTSPAIRQQLADQYTSALAKVNPQAAEAFRANAGAAIETGQALPVNPSLLQPGQIEGLPRTAEGQGEMFGGTSAASPLPGAAVPQPGVTPEQPDFFGGGGRIPTPEENTAQGDLFPQPGQAAQEAAPDAQGNLTMWPSEGGYVPRLPAPADQIAARTMYVNSAGEAVAGTPGFSFPDGTATNDHTRVNSYISGLPEDQRPAAWAQGVGVDLTPAVGPQADTNAKTVEQLHEEVTGSLTDAGIPLAKPMDRATFAQTDAAKDLKGQDLAKAYKAYVADPATQDALMREDADSYEKLSTEREAAPEPSLNPLVNEQAPEDRTNTQLSDSLQQALRQKQVDDAYSAYDAQREHETNLIATRAKGEQLANAAEDEEGTRTSTVQPDANAPKQADELAADTTEIKQASDGASDAAIRSFDARVGKLGLDDMATHQEQIDALRKASEGKMSVDVQGMMSKLADKWEAEKPAQDATAPTATTPDETTARTPADAQAVLGENIPPVDPLGTTEPGPKVDAVTASMPNGLQPGVRDQVPPTIKKLQGTIASFRDRMFKGEKLSDLEQQRFTDAKDAYQNLKDINTDAGQHDAATVQATVDRAKLTEKPYTQRLEQPLKMANPDVVDPAILAPAIVSHKLSDMLGHLAQNGSEPWVRDIAQRLGELGLKTSIHRDGYDPKAAGAYYPDADRINIHPGGESEGTILHEAVHAALYHTIERAQTIATPHTQAEAQLKRAYQDMEKVRTDALKVASPSDHYGLTNAQEFAAELRSNPQFQRFLESQGTGKSLWSRVVDAARRMLGMSTDERTALGKAMDASNVMLEAAQNERDFDTSPQGAAKATDTVLHSMAKVADRMGEKIPLDRLSRPLFEKMLGWKTVDFIAHQISGVPELVKSGFVKAVDDYRAARDLRRVVSEHVSDSLGDYVKRTQQVLRATKDPRGYGEKMMTVGGEASIHGFDYAKNFARNKADNASLDDSLKTHVDNIHRMYTQLPEQLKTLLREGEKQNRKSLVQTTAMVAANKLRAATGTTPRLEAELARMAPDDANRARMEDQINGARMESQLAATHMSRLDIMNPDLKTARNGHPDFHLDGASSALGGRLDAMFKDARDLPENSPMRTQMAELERMYTAQVQHPYFSLGRDGDYFVNVAFKPGVNAQTQQKLQAALVGTNKVLGNLADQTHAFFRVDTLDQAQGMYNKLLAAGGDAVDVPSSARGMLANMDMQNVAGITPALRQLNESLHDMVESMGLTPDQALEMKQTMTRQLMSMLPETSARTASLQRRGVPGYDADFVGNFARRASGNVQDMSNSYTNQHFGAAIKGMSDSITGLNRGGTADNATRAQMVANEINQRYANGMKRIDNTNVNLLNSLGHTFYLAASPAFYIRTMAQPWHRGLPILAAKYGAVRGAKEIAGATGVAMKVIANTIREGYAQGGVRGVLDTGMSFKGLGLSAAEEAFVQELHDRGILKLGQAQQLQHAISGASQRSQDVARIASMTAQYAEMTNRFTMGLASFRLATGAGDKQMTTQAATEWAIKNVNNAMDNFDPDNTARQIGKQGFAGKVTPLLTAFMNYQLQTMQQIVRTVQDGFFSKDQSAAGAQRSSEAKKEFLGLMATTAMISGVMGLPFANAAAGLYNTLAKDQDDPTDVRDSVRNFLGETFGQDGGDIISHGMGHLINMDTSTFGLENLLPGSEFLADRRTLSDRIESQSQQLMGPAINAGVDIALGMSKISDGYYVKGIEQMLPSGLKPYYKASELAGVLGPGGYTDSKGNPEPGMQAGSWDTALQAAGFRTSNKATRDEAAYSMSLNQQLLQHRRGVIDDQMFKAIQSGDTQAQQDAMGAMMQFSAKNPTQPMMGVQAAMKARMESYAVGAQSGLGMNLTKRELPAAQNKVGYAAMPSGQ